MVCDYVNRIRGANRTQKRAAIAATKTTTTSKGVLGGKRARSATPEEVIDSYDGSSCASKRYLGINKNIPVFDSTRES